MNLTNRFQEQGVSPASRLSFSPGKLTLSLALLLVAAVVVVYSPIALNGFVNLDDDEYITQNAHVKAGINRETVKWAFTTFDQANYHPLTWLSHALDCQLFGLAPVAHHEVNVLLHAANAVLLFLLLLSATGCRWRSWFVAALFALHPINVESVAWAAERKNVLSLLFFLLALLAYVAYSKRPKPVRYALVTFLFALGLLSKPQVITFPFLLLLLDYWPLNRFAAWPADREHAPVSAPVLDSSNGAAPPIEPGTPSQLSFGRIVIEKLPLLALSAASAFITMKAQKAGGAVQKLSLYSPLLRIETSIISYVRYLGKALWPTNLVAYYPHPQKLYPGWQVAAAAFLLVLLTVTVLYLRKRRYLAVGWFWYLGSLVPMIGLVQVGRQAIADRYAYIPFLGLFIALTWLITEVSQTYIGRVHRYPIRATWLTAPALAGLIVLGVLTHHQVSYWHDTESFWTRTIAVTEGNYIAHDMLAGYLLSKGQFDQAAPHFRAALAIQPDDLPAHNGLGVYDHAKGNLKGAIANYSFVAQWASDRTLRVEAFYNLGSAYRQLGYLTDAKGCFDTTLEFDPKHAKAMVGLGLIAQKQGNFAEAVRQYSRAMSIEPTYVGFLLMAKALDQQGRSDLAADIKGRVARSCPDVPAAQLEAEGLLSEN